jgi:hypothetical protein
VGRKFPSGTFSPAKVSQWFEGSTMSSVTNTSVYSLYSNPYINASKATGGQTSSAAATGSAPTEGTDADRQASIAKIYDEARSSVANHSAKSFLVGLSTEQLSLLQHANDLVDSINVNSLSEEGAENLLVDRDHRVDLNNDGFEEVGAAKIVQFPPPNAPQAVKDAWNAATSGLSDEDKFKYSIRFIGDQFLSQLNQAAGKSSPGDSLLSQISSPSFDWTSLFKTFHYDIDIARPYNTPEFSNDSQAFLDKFQTELQNRGVS